MKKTSLTLAKIIRKNFYKTAAIDVKTISIKERDWAQLWTQQRQLIVVNEQHGVGQWMEND